MTGSYRYYFVDNFATTSGKQRVVDTKRLWLNENRFYAGLRQEEKLTVFRAIYHSIPLAAGAVNVITKMVNSRMLPKSGNPDVDQRMREVWREIAGHRANGMLVRQSLIYGYALAEWSSETMQSMDKVTVPPSYEIRKIPNKQGDVEQYLQLPGFQLGQTTSVDGRLAIPSAKVVDLVRDPTDTFDYYGSSLFESAIDQLESLCQILKAQISVYMRLGRPRFLISVPSDGLSPEQFLDRLDKAKAAFSQVEGGADAYMPEGVDIKIIGAESFGQRFADETRLVVSQILACVGIPPAILNVVIQGSGGAESYLRQSVISMQTLLNNIQESAASAWNQSFWPIVQRMENLPALPVCSFERPRLLEQEQEEHARELKHNNDWREAVKGVRSAKWFVQQCGADEADDIAALEDQIDKARQTGEFPEETSNPDTQKNISTKLTDQQATQNTSE